MNCSCWSACSLLYGVTGYFQCVDGFSKYAQDIRDSEMTKTYLTIVLIP